MALVLTLNGFVGWDGPTDATAQLEARVAGDSQLVAVRYAGTSLPFTTIDDHTWSVPLKIVAGAHRAFFTFFSPGPDDISVVEVPTQRAPGDAAPAEDQEQEISGATHAVSPTLAPQIEGH
jgi:hypothetical protein